jgi:hypothetical protein
MQTLAVRHENGLTALAQTTISSGFEGSFELTTLRLA